MIHNTQYRTKIGNFNNRSHRIKKMKVDKYSKTPYGWKISQDRIRRIVPILMIIMTYLTMLETAKSSNTGYSQWKAGKEPETFQETGLGQSGAAGIGNTIDREISKKVDKDGNIRRVCNIKNGKRSESCPETGRKGRLFQMIGRMKKGRKKLKSRESDKSSQDRDSKIFYKKSRIRKSGFFRKLELESNWTRKQLRRNERIRIRQNDRRMIKIKIGFNKLSLRLGEKIRGSTETSRLSQEEISGSVRTIRLSQISGKSETSQGQTWKESSQLKLHNRDEWTSWSTDAKIRNKRIRSQNGNGTNQSVKAGKLESWSKKMEEQDRRH